MSGTGPCRPRPSTTRRARCRTAPINTSKFRLSQVGHLLRVGPLCGGRAASDDHTIRADTDATLPTLTRGPGRPGRWIRRTASICTGWMCRPASTIRAVGRGQPNDENELYVRYGALPTATAIRRGGQSAGSLGSIRRDSAEAQAGTYYVLVRCTYDLITSDGYTIRTAPARRWSRCRRRRVRTRSWRCAATATISRCTTR